MKSLKSIFAGFSIVIVLTSNVGSALAVDAGQSCKSAGSATTSKYKGKKVQLKCSKVGNKLRWVQVKTTTTTTVSPQSTTNLNPLGGNDPEDFLMPNVVCMNLQEAQDEIQDHGVFYSKSKDASGRNRMQLNDSNWVVVKQYPAPGKKIKEGEAILSAVKKGESTGGVCP